MSRFCLAALFALAVVPTASRAQTPLTRESLGPGLTNAIFLTHAPGDSTRLFILDRAGRILIKRPGLEPTVFLDMRTRVTAVNESGLLGLAFHPQYAQNGYFYVKYTQNAFPDPLANLIARFQASADPDVADPLSHTLILRTSDNGTTHNGGWIGFGPDGFLYITQGDNAGSPQSLNSFGGKILRLDVDGDDFPGDAQRNYAIPPGNPYVGMNGADEIYALGLRNPWRASFDRETGDLWIGDVGESSREEIDLIPPGQPGLNFGYPYLEGIQCNSSPSQCSSPAYTAPVHDYSRAFGSCVIGGYVYRGCAIPDLRGAYVFGDYGASRIGSFRRAGSGITDFRDLTTQLGINFFVSLGEDAAGELHICSLNNGVHKIVPVGAAAPCPPLGDLNCDGAINFADVDPFLAALLVPADYYHDHPTCLRRLADLDGSGRIDFLDIDPFVACLFDAVCP